ncbi:hypothetical protein ACK3TF_004975 [Chlorella vulgaris]
MGGGRPWPHFGTNCLVHSFWQGPRNVHTCTTLNTSHLNGSLDAVLCMALVLQLQAGTGQSTCCAARRSSTTAELAGGYRVWVLQYRLDGRRQAMAAFRDKLSGALLLARPTERAHLHHTQHITP